MFEDSVNKLLARWRRGIELAHQLHSVSQASRALGLARGEIYNAQWAEEQDGPPGLRARAERAVRRQPHYIAAVAREVTQLAHNNPHWGRKRLAQTLAASGYPASPSHVRRILFAHVPTAQGSAP